GGRPQSLKAGTDSAPPSRKHPHQLFNRPERPFGPGNPAHRATPADSSYPSSTIRPHRPASIGPNHPKTPQNPPHEKSRLTLMRAASIRRSRSPRPSVTRALPGSIGSVGDALDNALMESAVGLYKSELIDQHSTFTGRAEL